MPPLPVVGVDTRLQQDFDNGSEHLFRSANDLRRSKQPHAVDQPDQALLIAAQHDLVVRVSVQQQVRRVHDEVSINRLPLLDLTCDSLEAILAALGVDGRDQGGTTAHDGPQERRDRTQESWIDVQDRLQQVSPSEIRCAVRAAFGER